MKHKIQIIALLLCLAMTASMGCGKNQAEETEWCIKSHNMV